MLCNMRMFVSCSYELGMKLGILVERNRFGDTDKESNMHTLSLSCTISCINFGFVDLRALALQSLVLILDKLI